MEFQKVLRKTSNGSKNNSKVKITLKCLAGCLALDGWNLEKVILLIILVQKEILREKLERKIRYVTLIE